MEGHRLIVANVGDSRGVMCDSRGNAIPLSFDHKPQQVIHLFFLILIDKSYLSRISIRFANENESKTPAASLHLRECGEWPAFWPHPGQWAIIH